MLHALIGTFFVPKAIKSKMESKMRKIYLLRVNPKRGPPFTSKDRARSQFEALCIMQEIFTVTVVLIVLVEESKHSKQQKEGTTGKKSN